MSNTSILKQQEDTADHIRDALRALRTFRRQTVVWPAVLTVNDYEFSTTAYDISQGGVRLKLDLPIARGTQVEVKVKDRPFIRGVVMWQASGFIGLNYIDDMSKIKSAIGDLLHLER